ncbi:MAG: YgeY family selenium metabolism-linked hydrolase, partial [bacterium]|nr:YgeY family selenium metabolism-linked hydrolase [bacterium]
TPGSESNVKEIFDACWEIRRSRPEVVVFNQFDEFGNYLWHYGVTGPAAESAYRLLAGAGDRFAAWVGATGSGGTLATGDYLKHHLPGCRITAAEALQCPTLLHTGFGAHRIEGIGDKHVPWIHNARTTDAVAAVDDEATMRLLRLFNEPAGRTVLASYGVAEELIERLPLLGISSICNLLAAIKTARYFELDRHDVVVTSFTDSVELYRTRLAELEQENGPYSERQAAVDFERYLLGTTTDHFRELRFIDRKAIHNLKYFTWVEQQGKAVEELNALWSPSFWEQLVTELPRWDEQIEAFNDATGVLDRIRNQPELWTAMSYTGVIMTEGLPDTGKAAIGAAQSHEKQIVDFLRQMIAIPAESRREGERCERVRREYESLGFDEVFFDRLGNVVARIGDGPFKVLFDGHIDCVGVGDPEGWELDPFEGKLADGKVWGRGAVDELPAIACMAYGAKIFKERGLPDDLTVYLTASVMEEECDGYCLLHLVEKEGIRPHVVVLGEPTDLKVYRGHRGRLEATITTRGVAAHGAHCERGINALYKMAPIIADVEALNERLVFDEFLGKGSVVVSFIECTAASLNAVPDSARIYIDRRLTAGETVESAMAELRSLPHLGGAAVELLAYDGTSWRGERAQQEKYYPTWVLPEEHPLVEGVANAVETVLGAPPAISRWSFSTNGVASMGRLDIPTVGFAPGLEELSHTTGEWVAVEDLIRATAAYSLIPEFLAAHKERFMAAPEG